MGDTDLPLISMGQQRIEDHRIKYRFHTRSCPNGWKRKGTNNVI